MVSEGEGLTGATGSFVSMYTIWNLLQVVNLATIVHHKSIRISAQYARYRDMNLMTIEFSEAR